MLGQHSFGSAQPLTIKPILLRCVAQAWEQIVEDQPDTQLELTIEQAAGIVAAYVSNNHVQISELSALIANTVEVAAAVR